MNRSEHEGGLRAFRIPAIGYTLFVIYGCLVPLRFVWIPWSAAWIRYAPVRTFHLGHLYRTDFVANIILFSVFAFLWAGTVGARPGGAGGILRSILVWCAGILFVLALEFAQIFVPARSVSFYDVIAGSIGAAAGLVAWWIAGAPIRRTVDRWGEVRGREGVARWLLAPYVVFILLYDLMPLDLTSSPQVIYSKWSRGMIRLIPFSGWHGGAVEVLWSLGAEALIWIPVSTLWTLGRGAPFVGWCLTVLLAMAIECAQILVKSRVCDATDVVCAAVGAAIGAWIGARVRSRDAAAHALAASREARRAWAAAVAFFVWAAFVAAASWYPFDFVYIRERVPSRLALLFSVPFRAYWAGTEYAAFDELLKNVVLFIPLGAALAIVFARVRGDAARRTAAAGSLIAVAMGAFLIEAAQVFLPSKTPDSADWLLATAGAAAGYAGTLALARRLGATGGGTAPERRADAASDPEGAAEGAGTLRVLPAAVEARAAEAAGDAVKTGIRFGGAAVAFAVGYAVLLLVSSLAASSRAVPYNVRELFARGGAISVAVFPLVLFAAFAPPMLAARWTAHDGWRRSAYLPALAVLHALAAWAAVRAVVPTEAIHDVVGSPILRWPWEWELIGRFTALFGAVALLLAGGSLLAGVATSAHAGHYARGFLRWIAVSLPALLIAHWVVVTMAATDNLTELMAGGGGLGASVMLGLWLLAVATGGSGLAAVTARGRRRISGIVLALVSVPAGWVALTLGTASSIVKYDRTFSAMQFLLSPDRAHYRSGADLVLRYGVAHAALLIVIALTQAPARSLRRKHGRAAPPASRPGRPAPSTGDPGYFTTS